MVRQPEKKHIISTYCSFLIIALLPFQCIIKEIKWDSITAPELYPEGKIEKKKTMSQRKGDMFVGEETEEMLNFIKKFYFC